ncbi:MFS transporter [Nonomuraea diastatica]|uniref:MFS transporter n=1 Tax=Nonomuraea diastatica TaxID=1848329 RepID=UPI001C707988|nr:MFS transporter [Nonomuraea diastatica]
MSAGIDTAAAEQGAKAPDSGRLSRREVWTLVVVMAGTFMAIMDSFIVNVAVPSIRAELSASFSQVELAVSGYVLVYGLLLVTGGRLGDLYGTRRLFLAGTWVFLLGSLATGLAPIRCR